MPADPIEREALAHRLVAERCLYGVDKNPMAVEMAKLSLWLITLAKDRPFSFVDHALRAGDSLLGVTDLQAAPRRAPRPELAPPGQPRPRIRRDRGRRRPGARAPPRARGVRRPRRRSTPSARPRCSPQADAALDDARLLGDLVVGAALAQLDDADPLDAADVARNIRDDGRPRSARARADGRRGRSCARSPRHGWSRRRRAVGEVPEVVWADRHPFHWALEFPEVRERGGFDAIVGNPPFQGGKKISGALGGQYRDYLVEWLAGGARGNADLVAYFYLRASMLLRPSGGFGLIATNTIAQGDTREVGLDQLADGGWTIHRAIASEPWPGGASLEMATVWARRDGWAATSVLDRVEVGGSRRR